MTAHADSAPRARQLVKASAIGAAAGLAGVAAMTLGEELEQKLTKRPDSFVPARALLTLLGRHPGDNEQPAAWNHVMHWSTGALLGALRGVSLVSYRYQGTAGERLAHLRAARVRPNRRERHWSGCTTTVLARSRATCRYPP
jgi:hypothetical protein